MSNREDNKLEKIREESRAYNRKSKGRPKRSIKAFDPSMRATAGMFGCLPGIFPII